MAERYFKMFSIEQNDDQDIVIECLRDGCSKSKPAIFGDYAFQDHYLYSGYSSSSGESDKSDLLLQCICCGVSELADDVPWGFRGSTKVHHTDIEMVCLSCNGLMEYEDENDQGLIYKCTKCRKTEQI